MSKIEASRGGMMRQVVLYPDLEDGGWIPEAPSLPGCMSQGETKQEALKNIQDAIEVWIAGSLAVGTSVPDERFDVQVCVVGA